MRDTVAVPREATDAMLHAVDALNPYAACAIWKAFLSAAPPSEPGEVERLTRDYNELRETYDGRVAELNSAEATVERLTIQAESDAQSLAVCGSNLRAAEAALAEAREALRPFAEYRGSDWYLGLPGTPDRGECAPARFLAGDYRRARDVYAALIEQQKAEPEGEG